MPKFQIIVAADQCLGIGKDGALPWQLPGDMAFFKRVTMQVGQPEKQNAVIMGRKTWDSIPARFRPLKGRLNIVISRQESLTADEGVIVVGSLDSALVAADRENIENVFLIGGGTVYAEACRHPDLERIMRTDVRGDFACDTFFPEIEKDFVHLPAEDSDVVCDNGTEYVFRIFERKTPSRSCLASSD